MGKLMGLKLILGRYLDTDVMKFFPDAKSVNEALRTLINLLNNGHPSAPTNPIDTSIQKKTDNTLPFTIKATKKEYSFRII
jgi:hypothetical protein